MNRISLVLLALSGCGGPDVYNCDNDERVDLSCGGTISSVVWCGQAGTDRTHCMQVTWWEEGGTLWSECQDEGELRVWCEESPG